MPVVCGGVAVASARLLPRAAAAAAGGMFDLETLDEALPVTLLVAGAGTSGSTAHGGGEQYGRVVDQATEAAAEGGAELAAAEGGAELEAAMSRRLVPAEWSSLVDRLSRSVGLQGRALEAMRLVDRGEFVLAGSNAYDDVPQRIGHMATISAPHMHAMALNVLAEHLRPGCRALDVGCGSGFLAAVMAHLVGPEGLVVGIDYLEPLVDLAHENVCKSHGHLLRSARLRLEVGDGWKGCPLDAPFDAIHVGAAASETPRALVEQLKPGGRMVIPLGQTGRTQAFMQVDKDVQGKVSEKRLVDVMYVPLVQVPDRVAH